MPTNPFIKQAIKVLTVGALAVTALSPGATAEARNGRPQVDLAGTGTYEMDQFDIFARGVGSVTGTPFDGTATFLLKPDDGTWPKPGECEQGTAGFAVTGKKRQYIWGISIGEVCGQFLQEPTSVTTQVFTAEYSIVDAPKRVRDTEGWIEIRLATDGRMSITLFDS